ELDSFILFNQNSFTTSSTTDVVPPDNRTLASRASIRHLGAFLHAQMHRCSSSHRPNRALRSGSSFFIIGTSSSRPPPYFSSRRRSTSSNQSSSSHSRCHIH